MDDLDGLQGHVRRGTLTRGNLLKGAAAAGIGASSATALLAGTERASAHGSAESAKETLSRRGLRCHLNRILFLTVNVSDLERAIEFYERTYPVTRAEQTNGPAQAYRGLGIEHGQFEGRIMRDAQPFQGERSTSLSGRSRARSASRTRRPTTSGTTGITQAPREAGCKRATRSLSRPKAGPMVPRAASS